MKMTWEQRVCGVKAGPFLSFAEPSNVLGANMHRLSLSLALFSVVCLCLWAPRFTYAVDADPQIVPAVQQWQGGAGHLDMSGAVISVSASDEKLLRPTAELFQAGIAGAGLPKPQIVIGNPPGGKPAVVFVLTQTPFKAGGKTIEEQSYSVEIAGNAVTITGHNRAGVFYGTQSVLQMLAGGPVLPCGKIIDGPVIRNRMLMLDVGRKPFPMNALYDYLSVLGWYRMNVLHLHLSEGGFRVQCDTFPGLTSTDCFYTKQQLRDLQDRAAAMGIMILPEIDMPGHAAKIVRLWPELAWKGSMANLDVTNPQTVERLQQLLDEMIPVFDAPYFHIGCDEYSLHAESKEEAAKLKEAFCQFINTMNAHIRSKGKTCITWDGPHLEGPIKIDPTVVVDAWLQRRDYTKDGHAVINSDQSHSYLTAGKPTYGINTPKAYEHWQPSVFGHCSPESDDPKFLGAKLHVWVGHGPTGWTMTEIADQTIPNIAVFAEKMWGRQGSANYQDFLPRSKAIGLPSSVTLLNRLPASTEGIVLRQPAEVTLSRDASSVPLPLAHAPRADLEFPWTLSMEVRKTAANGRGVILSSDLAEICDSYQKPVRAPDAGKTAATTPAQGFGIVRAAGSPGATPAESAITEPSRVFADALPLDKWVGIVIIATRGHTELYFDGKMAGQQNKQMICPLKYYGSADAANSLIGQVRKLQIWNRSLSPAEIVELGK